MKTLLKGIVFITFLFISFIAFAQVNEQNSTSSDESTMLLSQDMSNSVATLAASPTNGAFFQVLVSLAVVSALVYGFIRLLRRLSGRTTIASRSINVLSSQTLTPSTSVHIVDIEGDLYILGSGDTVNLIGKIDDQEKIDKIRLDAEKTADVPLNFMQLLAEKLNKENLEMNKPLRRQFMMEQMKRLNSLSKDRDDKDKQQEERE